MLFENRCSIEDGQIPKPCLDGSRGEVTVIARDIVHVEKSFDPGVLSRFDIPVEVCVEEAVTYFSTIESARAALEAIDSADEPMTVQDITSRPRTQRQWGE